MTKVMRESYNSCGMILKVEDLSEALKTQDLDELIEAFEDDIVEDIIEDI